MAVEVVVSVEVGMGSFKLLLDGAGLRG